MSATPKDFTLFHKLKIYQKGKFRRLSSTAALTVHILPRQCRFHAYSPSAVANKPLDFRAARLLCTLFAGRDRCVCCNISVQSVCSTHTQRPAPSRPCSALRAVAADVLLLHCCSAHLLFTV